MFPFSSALQEYAQDRQTSLRQEADKYRLLQQCTHPPFLRLRRLILATGQLLIVGGLWLKASTRLEPTQTEQRMAGRFPKALLQ